MHSKDVPPAIAQFSTKVKSASNRGSKEIVIPMTEALDLTVCLNQLLLRQNQLLQDIVVLQKQLIEGTREISLDGGGFDSD